MLKRMLAISVIFSVATYCSEYNPTNFRISIEQKDLVGATARNVALNFHMSNRHLGEESEYAAKVYMYYPPLYIIIGNRRKYIRSIKFELYKEKSSDYYTITYEIQMLFDSVFSKSNIRSKAYNVSIKNSKANDILKNTPYLRKDDLGRFGEQGAYFSDLAMMTVPRNLQMLKDCVKLLNMVLPNDRKIMFDKDDLNIKYPSWFSKLTWRRKILGL